MAKSPEQRYSTGTEMASAFSAALDRLGNEPVARQSGGKSMYETTPIALPERDALTAPVPTHQDALTAPVPTYSAQSAPARPASPARSSGTSAKPPSAAPRPAPATRSPLPVVLLIGIVAIAVIVVLVVATSSGGSGQVAADDQTATRVALLAGTSTTAPTETDLPSATPQPVVGIITPSTSTPTVTSSVQVTSSAPPLVGIIASNTPTSTRTPSATLTPTVTFTFSATATTPITPSPPPSLTPSNTATGTNTATATATPDLELTSTAQRIAAIQQQAAVVTEVVRTGQVIFGPDSSQLPHDAGPLVVSRDTGVDVADFVVEARFFNPYDPAFASWDYGFLFRSQGQGQQYRLILRSQGDLALVQRVNDQSQLILNIPLPMMDTATGGSNLVRFGAFGREGYFFVNEELAAVLDLSGSQEAGDISIATGIIGGSKVAGRQTRYEGFTIWRP